MSLNTVFWRALGILGIGTGAWFVVLDAHLPITGSTIAILTLSAVLAFVCGCEWKSDKG